MQQVILSRFIMSEYGTFSAVSIDDNPVCVAVELPWKNNAQFVSCIPAGIYNCTKMVHIKHGVIWKVNDVVGRSGVLIHEGNTIKDVLGCIAMGRYFGSVDGLPAVMDSDNTMTELRTVFEDEFDLIIRDGYSDPTNA